MPSWRSFSAASSASANVAHVPGSSERAREPERGEYGTLVGLPSLFSERQHTHCSRSFMPSPLPSPLFRRACALTNLLERRPLQNDVPCRRPVAPADGVALVEVQSLDA